MSDVLLRFIHLTDTHLAADAALGHPQQPWTPAEGTLHLIEAVNALPFMADFVLHTGDVVYDPDEKAYLLAREMFAGLRAPVYFMPGNHDSSDMLQRLLIGRTSTPTYDYEFEVNGVQIVCLDSSPRHGENAPHTFISDAQIAWLRETCTPDDPRPLIVATHHNVLPAGAPWLDDFMRMRNGEELHAALLPARQRLLGVLHGHVHMVGQRTRDGITYHSSPSSWMQFLCHPGQTQTVVDHAARPGFNEITVMSDGMYLRHHFFGA
ncbi:MAG: metallophosphoesterase [Anaerolineae bacterium]|nr:metallophosphoesterase [Anaerolineae bacterium]